MKTDIRNLKDIQVFVDRFYSKVRKNEKLAPVFTSRIKEEEWPAHLQRMYSFWNAILFAETGFQGNPMQKHMTLPIDQSHFDQWLLLFCQTIDETFAGPKAEEAKKRAESIADIMSFKIRSHR